MNYRLSPCKTIVILTSCKFSLHACSGNSKRKLVFCFWQPVRGGLEQQRGWRKRNIYTVGRTSKRETEYSSCCPATTATGTCCGLPAWETSSLSVSSVRLSYWTSKGISIVPGRRPFPARTAATFGSQSLTHPPTSPGISSSTYRKSSTIMAWRFWASMPKTWWLRGTFLFRKRARTSWRLW